MMMETKFKKGNKHNFVEILGDSDIFLNYN